jgi:hypothetical protein
MRVAIMKTAVGSLDKLLSEAKQALRAVESELFNGDSLGYENPSAALKWCIEELHVALSVVLEAADMPGARASLNEAMKKFIAKGLDHIVSDPEYYICESPALTYLERVIKALRMTVSESLSSEEGWVLSRLEAMLHDTAGLVRRRKAAPAKESELQEIMHDYLSASFPDFVKTPVRRRGAESFQTRLWD